MFEQEYRELQSGVWAHPNPCECPCRGRGWFNSDFDVAFECPIHGGTPHPEDEDETFNWAAHDIRVCRKAWRDAQVRSGMERWAFRVAVEAHIRASTDFAAPTMREWVAFAFDVAEHEWTKAQEERAQRMGYSCRLEAAWDAEARVEAEARACGMDPDRYATRGSPERAEADSWY